MKKIYILILWCFGYHLLNAQSDNCISATLLTVSANCSSPVSGTSSGATQSIPGCVGNADDDVWYKFSATGSSHVITVTGSTGYDPVVEFFSGSCTSLVSLSCMDNTFGGQAETITIGGLTVGVTYYIRVFNYGTGSGSNNFSICLTNPPPPPANNICTAATNLMVNTNCSGTAGTTFGATQSLIGCSGTANDVWYTFTANSYTQTISVTGSSNMDAVIELFSGNCSTFTSLNCADNTFIGGVETINAVGLTPGQTYLIRVSDYYGDGYPFSICIIGNSIGSSQPNDDPCSAIQLPAVTSSCNYLRFGTNGATNTGTGLAPAPFSCVGSAGAYTASDKDVWFKITVPASGNVYITPEPNLTTAGYITNPAMALYTGSNCSSLTQYTCSNDYTKYPGSSNDLLPYITATGLTPGSSVYLRYWGTSATQGTFGICVQSPTNDNCANALYVCDINGYSGSTSGAYTPDRPGTGSGQMKGNNENSSGTNLPNGTNSGGVFGYYPPSNVAGPYSSPAIDVNIENNSWIKFTAANTTANLKVTVGNCWVGNYPTGGIQMQVFSAGACTNFLPVSSFKEGSSTFTVTAFSLTVGNDYYLMVDGYANDICNYTIQALSGVAFPAITALPDSICPNFTSNLTAPVGATAYQWFPGGQTTRTITVAPGSTQTFTCVVSGVCGYKQTLTKTVYVKSTPTVLINSGSPISTCGTQTITLTGSGANTYTWNTSATTPIISVSPSSNTTYTLTGLGANSCTNIAIATITVYTVPQLASAPNISSSNCGASTGSITGVNISGTPLFTYTWTNGSGTNIANTPNITGQPAGVYNLQVQDGNNCINNFGPYSISNPGAPPAPAASATDSLICEGETIDLFANGTNTLTYTWSGPNAFTSNIQNPIIPNATVGMSGVYSVYSTAAGCSGPAANVTITVNPLATPVATSSKSVFCEGDTINLYGFGATTYSWTGPGGYTSTLQNPIILNADASSTGIYTLDVTNASGCVGSTTLNIGLNLNPVLVSISNDSTCTGGQLNLLADFGTGVNVNWYSDPALTNLVQVNSNTYQPILSIDGIYTYYAKGSFAGCSSPIATITAQYYNIQAVASADIYSGFAPLSVNFTGSNSIGVTSTDNFSWYFDDNLGASIIDPSHTFQDGGTYTVVLTVKDQESGCSDTATVIIKIEGDVIVVVPNVFTPNDDGANDLFHIDIRGAKSVEGFIYNRWGQLLQSWDGINSAWDGKASSGENCPDATYYYLIKVIDKKDKEHLFPGYVLIVR